MTKRDIDLIINHLRKADLITQSPPWIHEEHRQQDCQVRYAGISTPSDWEEIINANNNLLLKFITCRQFTTLELYLANKPPFIKITYKNLSPNDKWETIFGEIKRQLKRDKEDFRSHSAKVGNMYQKIADHLK